MKKLWLVTLFTALAVAAPADRIRSTVDTRVTRSLQGNLHRLARPEADRGPVDPLMRMDDVVLTFRPSAAQQAELDQLLADQQNPNSPRYRQWLTPEEYGARFGLSPADESKVIAWLKSQGLAVRGQARGRNWVAFSGSARQVGLALRTEIHRFIAADGEHFANSTEPSIPAALAGIAGGFMGLDDFLPESQARQVPGPQYNLGSSHYLVPEDLATIYNIAPLYKSGLDGTAQGIVVVGQSAVSLDDLRTFRSRHKLPATDPKMIPYGTDPGYTSAEIEGALDLEWAGAVAPKANLYYVYGTSAFTAMNYAINLNIAPVISVSYGTCEINASPLVYRAMMQQANAQGITVLAASGDAGAANCDRQGSAPLASKGLVALFPAVLPEVTAVGGTTFADSNGTYWGTANSSANGSALSYIPETAWNESGTSGGLGATGGGISRIYPKPAWQVGSGVTDSSYRQYPDVSLSAAVHDAYIVVYHGSLTAVGGTSAGTPSFAGVVALLNQYQVTKGAQARPGLGNINPQLYRLAQSAPNAFHDITAGDNIVPCTLGSPDCLDGKYGYAAGPGYDLATGLGSIDANNLFVNWNSKTSPVTVALTLSAARPTINDSVTLTATVTSPAGGTPTGSVDFSVNYVPLGSAALAAGGASQVAELTIPAYRIGSGTSLIVAAYSGDVAFSGGGAEKTVTVSVPSATANISFSAPSAVWPNAPDPLGWTWQTPLTIRETAGTGAMLTGLTIDGQDEPLSKYFSSTTIPANGSISGNFIVHDLTTPSSRTFAVTGIDASGNTWTRQALVTYMPIPAVTYFLETATPLVINQNTADPSCPWPVQVNVEDWGGSLGLISAFYVGGVDYTSQVPAIFGTGRLEAWSSLQGTVCVSGIKPPASEPVEVDLSTGQTQQVMVSFAGPPANPVTLSAAPQAVTMEARDAGRFTQAALNFSTDKAAEWSVTVLPGNRTTGWLTVSPLSGRGPAQLSLTARGSGFGNGAYRALLVFQSNSASPQTLTVPVMFVVGPNSSGIAIGSMGNAASYKPIAAPGSLISVFGSQLAGATKLSTGSPIDFANSGVTATVNGVPAPVVYASPTQLNVQVPYAAGAGPAVLGINNNGQVAGYLFQVAPAAPAIFTDVDGAVFPKPTAKAGALATMYVTGIGEVTPALKTAYAPSSAVTSQAKPVLPVSVTVGGVAAFVQVAALAPNQIGTAQISFLVPAGTAPGAQPVVITVGGASSPPATLTVE